MQKNYQKILRDQLTQRLKEIQKAALDDMPRMGWIRSLRLALGMSTTQLAKRLRVAQPSVSTMEKREVAGTITLASLRKAADAMQCDVVYALVPRKPIEVIIDERAHGVAIAKVGRVSHSMALEQQANSDAYLVRLIEAEATRLAHEASRELWDEPK